MSWFCPFVCVSFPVGQPDPNAIANTNPDPPTSADREVPIHGWRLVVAPCGLVMWLGFGVCCALGVQGAISLLSWFCFAARFSICSLTGTYTRIYHYTMCVCVFSSHPFWTSSSLDVPAGVTQEEGHTGFLIHLPSAVHALIFLARRIQPFLSLVDREVEFCVLTN